MFEGGGDRGFVGSVVDENNVDGLLIEMSVALDIISSVAWGRDESRGSEGVFCPSGEMSVLGRCAWCGRSGVAGAVKELDASSWDDGYLGDDDVLVASIQKGLVGSALLALLKGGGARRGARGEFCGGMWRRTYGTRLFRRVAGVVRRRFQLSC